MNTVNDYSNRLSLISESLGLNLGTTAEEFKFKTEEILSKIPNNSVNIKNGICLPLVLPRFEGDDIGFFLENLLAWFEKSYNKAFDGNRSFHNFQKGRLNGMVKTVNSSRQDQLIEKMKQGPVVVIFFPDSLQGFSISASHEQMETLPEGFILSGIETIIAMIMYPEILARDPKTLGLILAGLSWRSSDFSLFFWTIKDRLLLDDISGLHIPSSNSSSGLSFIG